MTTDGLHHPTRGSRRGAIPVENTRARIAEVAERLFRTMGYQKTAVADIARELGMSPANVYRFFPSKSAINEAIAERLLSGIRADVRALAADAAVPPPERLRRLLRLVFERHLALFFAERRLHDMVTAAMAEHWSVVEGFIGEVERSIAVVIAEGQASGAFAPGDAAALARLVRQAVLLWTHPVMLADCLTHGQDEGSAAAGMEAMTEFCLRALQPSNVE